MSNNGQFGSTTVEALCQLVVDCPHSTPKWTDEGVLVFRSPNIRDGRMNLSQVSFTTEEHYQKRIKRAIPTSGDLIITREAPMGEVAIIPPGVRGCLGQRMVLLRPDPSAVDGRFLLYALMSPEVQSQIRCYEGTGSTVSNLRIPALKELLIPSPSLNEQRAIASVLGALDDKIELNRQMNRTLEEMAAALFKSWFVDFDPVHAKAEGRRPFGMDHETAALFPDRFVETEEGPVPEGWEVMTLPEFMAINPKRILGKGVEASYVPMTAAPTSGHAPSVVETRVKGSGATFVNGDTLLAKITPCLENGKTVYVDCLADGEVGWGSTEFIVLRPHTPWPEAFGYVLARYPEFRAHAEKSMTGTSGRQRVQLDDLKQFRQVLPTDDSVPLAFGDLITPLFDLAGRNAKEATTLADLRDTLLPKLLSGEIRLKQAEKAVEGAL